MACETEEEKKSCVFFALLPVPLRPLTNDTVINYAEMGEAFFSFFIRKKEMANFGAQEKAGAYV